MVVVLDVAGQTEPFSASTMPPLEQRRVTISGERGGGYFATLPTWESDQRTPQSDCKLFIWGGGYPLEGLNLWKKSAFSQLFQRALFGAPLHPRACACACFWVR